MGFVILMGFVKLHKWMYILAYIVFNLFDQSFEQWFLTLKLFAMTYLLALILWLLLLLSILSMILKRLIVDKQAVVNLALLNHPPSQTTSFVGFFVDWYQLVANRTRPTTHLFRQHYLYALSSISLPTLCSIYLIGE